MEIRHLDETLYYYITDADGTIQNCEYDRDHYAWYLGAGIQSARAEMMMVKTRQDQQLGMMMCYTIRHMGGFEPYQYLWNVAEQLPKNIPLRGLQCLIGKELFGGTSLNIFIPYPMEHERIRQIADILDAEVYRRVPEYQIHRCRQCPSNRSNPRCSDGSRCRFVQFYMDWKGRMIGVDGNTQDGYAARCLNEVEGDEYLPWSLNLHACPEPEFDRAQETLNRVAQKQRWVFADSLE